MSITRDGSLLIGIAALVAVAAFALALNRRSWPLWLLAYLFTIGALWVAYFFREPVRTGSPGVPPSITAFDMHVPRHTAGATMVSDRTPR